MAVQVDHDAATGEVRGGYHRNLIFGDVDAELQHFW
jgi:hypothetical protein